MKKIYFLILYGILISAAGYGNAVPFKSFYDYSKLQLEAQLTKAKTAEE